jgi:hypothetical protein
MLLINSRTKQRIPLTPWKFFFNEDEAPHAKTSASQMYLGSRPGLLGAFLGLGARKPTNQTPGTCQTERACSKTGVDIYNLHGCAKHLALKSN